MEVTTTKLGATTVIAIRGRLDSATATAAQESIMPLLVPDCRAVIDMSGCEYVSSAGLRLLLLIAKTVARNKGKAHVAGMPDEIREVMEMTGFGNMFPSFATVNEAAAGLAGDAA